MATTAKATAAASDPVIPGTAITQMISSAACALTILAFLAAAARLAVTANTAGLGWPCPLFKGADGGISCSSSEVPSPCAALPGTGSDFTAGWLNLSDDVMVQLINQAPVLLGVIIGALGSYLTTAATERARWKRALDSRWDDRRVEAYASYAQSVKRMIKVAGRIAAGRDLGGDDEPLAPTQENLELLADAEAERGRQWETVLLLGHPQTVAAGRSWHERAWRLEAYARGLLTGSNSDWQAAISAADDARHAFYESARIDLGVGGGALPGAGPHNTRAQRIRNLSD